MDRGADYDHGWFGNGAIYGKSQEASKIVTGTDSRTCLYRGYMAAMKISEGPRYRKPGSPSQKKARKLAEMMVLVMNDALSGAERKVRHQTERRIAFPKEA